VLSAFMKISNAVGESKQVGYPEWIEIQAWDWDVEAETSWTKGGGASVGKPNPGKMNWEHYWDKSSNVLLSYICTGASFAEIHLHMCKTTGSAKPQPFFDVRMWDAYITKVAQSATEDGNVLQKVEMVFKKISIDYSQQGAIANNPGALKPSNNFTWDISIGQASNAQK
jgi:type VI secretion system secreted protein Hcp